MRYKSSLGISTVSLLIAASIAFAGFVGWSLYKKSVEKAATEQIAVAATKAAATMASIHAKWIDSMKLAASTPRMGLAGPVSKLQALRQEVQDIASPSCITAKKQHLVNGMDAGIDAFLAFMRNDLPAIELDDFMSARTASMTSHFGEYTEEQGTCPKESR